MEEKLHTAPGYCCKTVKYTRNEQRLPWLTDVQYITVQDQVAKVAPLSDPMVTIGRAFTRHMWDCGLLDDFFPVNFVDLPIAFNCVLNLLFESSHHYYDVCVSFKFVERYPDKKHHIGVTEKEITEFLLQRLVEGNSHHLSVEAKLRYLYKLQQVTCSMNGLDLVVS